MMKNELSLLFVCAFSFAAFSQTKLFVPNSTILPAQTGAGIGINVDLPKAELHIKDGTVGATAMLLDLSGSLGFVDPNGNVTGGYPENALMVRFLNSGNWEETFRVSRSGRVVSGPVNNPSDQISSSNSMGVYRGSQKIRMGYTSSRPEVTWASNNGYNLNFRSETTNKTMLTLSSSGKIGINTSDFFDSHEFYVGGSTYIAGDASMPHSLYVEGSVITEEAFVKLKADWPDYVFKKDYSLMPLEELDQFIEENGHLPEMPTAKEVVENGLALGETNRLLTQKVEELTLYIIALKKEVDELRSKKN